MSEAGEKAKKVLRGASALALAVNAEIDEQHGEVSRFDVLGMPLFKRTPDTGHPVIFGIKFPRWIRGPRER